MARVNSLAFFITSSAKVVRLYHSLTLLRQALEESSQLWL
jgi:hypothetical protein